MNKESLEKYAKDLKFIMKDNEYETLDKEFQILFKQMNLLDNIKDIQNYEPMDYPFVLEDAYLREDEANMNLDSVQAFSNSKDVKNGCVSTPKVVS